MRLDWIFLPRENPCAKFYIIIITMIMITITTTTTTNWMKHSIDKTSDTPLCRLIVW